MDGTLSSLLLLLALVGVDEIGVDGGALMGESIGVLLGLLDLGEWPLPELLLP